ncbi:hypothetical protein H9Y04_05315 [Streptomyces sp. TRM66268-LWL]|uniref:Uncharacterized protein n=1 Tax=Streptomyces polyasparticus TaxID=2767826 RepID=A0ABR7SCA9_9ACTN|nr:hypothetical protein [Streptomyces polyasparticus]MBC9711988.1 hypothetical protein [Streptomyces polyasparticus]
MLKASGETRYVRVERAEAMWQSRIERSRRWSTRDCRTDVTTACGSDSAYGIPGMIRAPRIQRAAARPLTGRNPRPPG